MAEKSPSPTKTVIVEPDVHAAVKVLSALQDKTMQEIINEAVRAQYDVDALANIGETVAANGDGDVPAEEVAEAVEADTSGAE